MMKCSKTDIGERIAELRKRHGETQDDLGKAVYVNREVVTHWEIGDRDLKTEYSIKLADHFGVTCDYILRGIPAENVSIAQELGLDNQSIESIKLITKTLEKAPAEFSFSDAMNAFISSNKFLHFVLALWDFMCKNKQFQDNLNDFDLCWNTNKPHKDPLKYAAQLSLDRTSDAIYQARSVMTAKESVDFSIFKLQQALNAIIINIQEGDNGNG